MNEKRKAVFPVQAGTLGKTASKTSGVNRNKNHTFRQRIKQIIVMMAVRGLLPVRVAEWIISRGGLTHA